MILTMSLRYIMCGWFSSDLGYGNCHMLYCKLEPANTWNVLYIPHMHKAYIYNHNWEYFNGPFVVMEILMDKNYN